MRKSLLFVALIALSANAFGQGHLRFVVSGDSRGKTNGVNVEGLTRVVQAMMAEKPAVIVLSGDLISGASTDEAEASQFATFMQVVKPVYDAGIKLLTVRGNHEIHAGGAKTVWQKTFTGPYANPGSGPKGEEAMTYAYSQGPAMFIALDEYQTENPVVNQDWLDKVLARRHPAHVFCFAHEMAFFSGRHQDGMRSVPEARDKFIDSLGKAGSQVVFFGHDHLYDRVAARRDEWPAGKYVRQLVIGTAGAPFYHGNPDAAKEGPWALTHEAHVEGHLGYVVVDIDGKTATFTFKGESAPGVFSPMDSFSYTLGK